MKTSKINALLILIFYSSTLFVLVSSQCLLSQGCLFREKYITLTSITNMKGEKARSPLEFKTVLFFKDRLVIAKSKSPKEANKEELYDLFTTPQNAIDATIERTIYYGQIIMDCGLFNNKLCQAGEYQEIYQNFEFMSGMETNDPRPENSNNLCIAIPFFENAYGNIRSKKITYFCKKAVSQIEELIKQKNMISRYIERYQLFSRFVRFTPFDGNLYASGKFLANYDNVMIPVIAKIEGKGVYLIPKDTESYETKFYSYNQVRKTGAAIAKDGLKGHNKVVPDDWNQKFNPKPNPNCCIYFSGEKDPLVLCKATQDHLAIETTPDLCAYELGKIIKNINGLIHGVKFSFHYDNILTKGLDRTNCESDDMMFFKNRILLNMSYSVSKDCKSIKSMMREKEEILLDKCYTLFKDEIDLEKKHISLSSDDDSLEGSTDSATKNQKDSLSQKLKNRKSFLEKLTQCIFEDKRESNNPNQTNTKNKFYPYLTEEYFKNLLKHYEITAQTEEEKYASLMKKSSLGNDFEFSFLQISNDEYTNDLNAKAKEVKGSFLGANSEENIADMSFTEVKTTNLSTNQARVQQNDDNNGKKFQEFDQDLRSKLQSAKTFLPQDTESFSSDNEKEIDKRGENYVMAQNFMSFLKYLGIKSKRVCSKNNRIMLKEKQNQILDKV